MSWLLVAVALMLSGNRRSSGRHRRAVAVRTESVRRPGLAAATVISVPVAGLLLAGLTGLLLAVPAGLAVAAMLRRKAENRRQPVDRLAVAYLLDLLAAALAAGAPTDQAIEAVGRCVRDYGDGPLRHAMEPFTVVGRLLRLGTEPQQAWDLLAGRAELAPVAAAARRCLDSGARLAGALAESADLLRSERHRQALIRAQRVGVWALLPLGCCFLPAFVCLGVLPVVLGVAGQLIT